MTVTGPLALFRRVEQRQFASTCTITRAGAGERVFDVETNDYTEPTPTTVYTGPCKVRRTARSGDDVDAGERRLREQDLEVTVPADTAVDESDAVTVTASPDPDLVGKTLRVTDVLSDDWQVNRRLAVEEVTVG